MDGSIVKARSDNWLEYVRPAVRVLEPYKWEISSSEVSARYGIPIDDVLRFDTNTSPFQRGKSVTYAKTRQRKRLR